MRILKINQILIAETSIVWRLIGQLFNADGFINSNFAFVAGNWIHQNTVCFGRGSLGMIGVNFQRNGGLKATMEQMMGGMVNGR